MKPPVSLACVACVAALLTGGCVVHAAAVTPGGPIRVVAAESFWGSIAAQLGGGRVRVTSIVANPDLDPHDYEPTPADARAVAAARYVVVNGLGYDGWATRLVAADGPSGPRVLDVGRLLGLRAGANPHRWYYPPDVDAVVRRISADYAALDPAHARSFAASRAAFETEGLGQYRRLLSEIRARFAGTPVGASESVVVGLVRAAGLDLVTPSSFLEAVSEGTDPTAGDKTIVDRQVAQGQIRVFLYNAQNATPDVQRLVDSARAHHIPVVAVTETAPARTSFQDWQVAQLERLEAALATGVGP